MNEKDSNPDEMPQRQPVLSAAQAPDSPEMLSPEAVTEALSQLRACQIELEAKNKELCQARAELEATRARYADLYNLAPVGHATIDESRRIVAANQTLADFVGEAKEALVNQSIDRYLLPDDQDIFARHCQQLFETGAPHSCELRLMPGNGRSLLVQLDGVLSQPEADGAPVCHLVIHNITAQKQTEKALRESEEIFTQFLEHSPIYVFFKDKDARSLRLSRNYEAMLGRPISELLGKTMDDLFPSDLAKNMVADDLRVLQEGKPIEIEEELNGRFYDTTKFPIIRDGEAQYLAGFTMDVTERKQAELLAQYNERRLKEAEAIAHFGYYELDIQTGEVIWSDETFRIFGLELADGMPTGGQFVALIHPEDVTEVLGMFAEAIQSGRPFDQIYRIYHASGEIRTVHSIGSLDIDLVSGHVKLFGTLHDITQHKRGEAALQKSENRFRALIENAPDAINLINLEGKLTYASPSALRLLGYTEEETRNLKMAELTHPDDVTAVLALLMDLVQTPGKVATTRYRFRHKDGSWRWLESTISNLLHEPGVESILFNFRDITQQKQAEELTRQQSEQIRLLYDASQRLNRTLDLDEIYHAIFDFLAAILPCDGLIISAFDPSTALITCQAHWIGQGESQDVSMYPPIPLEPEGQGTQSLAIRTGKPLLLNDYLAQMKTAQSAYFIDGDTNAVLQKDDLPADADVTRSALIVPIKTGEQVNGVIQVMSFAPNAYTENHLKLLEALALHINSAQTNARLFAQAQNELNERKLTETALLESHRHLEAALAELRQTQTQLIQQERLAAVGQLAAGIAHDFNNILAIIMLYAEMSLTMPNMPAELYTRMSTIVRQTERAAYLVQQILDFGRRAILQPHSLDLAAFLREQVELWQRTIPEFIRIRLDVVADECFIHADPTRLQQVFINLVLNARDAMPDGGELRLSLEGVHVDAALTPPLADMRAGDWVKIVVRDTGLGISQDALPHIYEPFFTTKEPGKGSGLGLAQVYGIIKQHNGHIDVWSESGRGTTFTIYLPAVNVLPAEETAVITPDVRQGNGETVLIVEDNATLREALASMLGLLNYRPVTAANGREALALLQQQMENAQTSAPTTDPDISLVLSDLVMPEIGGMELLQAIQHLGLALPVVILSGHPMEAEAQMLQNHSAAGWLQKPFDFQDLAHMLAQVLHGPFSNE